MHSQKLEAPRWQRSREVCVGAQVAVEGAPSRQHLARRLGRGSNRVLSPPRSRTRAVPWAIGSVGGTAVRFCARQGCGAADGLAGVAVAPFQWSDGRVALVHHDGAASDQVASLSSPRAPLMLRQYRTTSHCLGGAVADQRVVPQWVRLPNGVLTVYSHGYSLTYGSARAAGLVMCPCLPACVMSRSGRSGRWT